MSHVAIPRLMEKKRGLVAYPAPDDRPGMRCLAARRRRILRGPRPEVNPPQSKYRADPPDQDTNFRQIFTRYIRKN